MSRRGFTLVEIALVLAVIGVLVSISVPGYRAIVLRARASEARETLEIIADAELRHFRDRGSFVACAPEPKVPPRGTTAPFAGDAPGWKALGLHLDAAPVRYQYEVVVDSRTFRAIARGDLDGNGKTSTFTLSGDTLRLAVADELE